MNNTKEQTISEYTREKLRVKRYKQKRMINIELRINRLTGELDKLKRDFKLSKGEIMKDRIEQTKKKTNDEIIFECYRRMFKEAEPSADFDELHKKEITKKPEFFMAYFLSEDRIEEICSEVAKENKFKGLKALQLVSACFVGCSPNSCRETWEKLQNE